MAQKRDYKAEYQKRIARGLAKGQTRSEARGHGKPKASTSKSGAETSTYDRRLEEGVKAMRKGDSLTKAAKSINVAPERLRAYVKRADVGEKKSGRWFISKDSRSRVVPIFSAGKYQEITVGFEASQKAGAYMSAVNQFLSTNDKSVLDPFRGDSLVDVQRKRHFFETRPNVLYRLNETEFDSYEGVYRIVD
jgi:hypothetical protein